MPTEDHIALWDLYQAILALDKRVSAVETLVTSSLESVKDHEARIRGSERWAYAIPPAVLGSLAATAVAILR